MCHINETDFKRSKSHPLHTTEMKLPDRLFELGSVKAVNKDSVTCQTCHKVHGAKGKNITIIDNTDSGLCMICHQERSIEGTQHDLRLTLPDEKNIKNQSLSESGPCGACHLPHSSAGTKLWARGLDQGNPASQRCMTCHDKNPDDKIKDTGLHSHPVHVDINSKNGKKLNVPITTNKLPFFSAQGKAQESGLIECSTCHNVHQWDSRSPANKGRKDEEGNASNSFLRFSNGQSSALCLECHQDKKQLLHYDHNLALTAPEENNINQQNTSVSGPCGACHIPHNAAGKNLWAKTISTGEDLLTHYCLECHNKNGAAKEKLVGENDHPVNAECDGFNIASSSRVARTLPLFNKEGERESGKLIGCLTCHEPHAWGAGIKPVALADSNQNKKGDPIQNIEGNANNSFLRVQASPTPDLCVSCHEETAMLVGTDHDLFVTAPEAKNLMDQTVRESGQCGACHAAHNSPEKILLWARSLGPVAENQHTMNALCTSCHSEGAAAERKIPPVASHPAGQLISNVNTFNSTRQGYIPIFDSNNDEVNVGDLSCSSCHSFYQWDHRNKNKGTNKNVEGNANTSFLRISSDKTFCIDCHGKDALWRHTYFHSKQKRKHLGSKQPKKNNSFKMSF